ncbi:hypothetical protein EDB87DRAFT_623558 [Lactarius vividus]|nr:hypothetical protein EDB87DRAFT_623558 [Lactarius vividus]
MSVQLNRKCHANRHDCRIARVVRRFLRRFTYHRGSPAHQRHILRIFHRGPGAPWPSRSTRTLPHQSPTSTCVLRQRFLHPPPHPPSRRSPRPLRRAMHHRSTSRVSSACCRTSWTRGMDHSSAVAVEARAGRGGPEHPARCHGCVVAQGMRARCWCHQGHRCEGADEAQMGALATDPGIFRHVISLFLPPVTVYITSSRTLQYLYYTNAYLQETLNTLCETWSICELRLHRAERHLPSQGYIRVTGCR